MSRRTGFSSRDLTSADKEDKELSKESAEVKLNCYFKTDRESRQTR